MISWHKTTAYRAPPCLHIASMPVLCPSLFSRLHGLSHPYLSHQTKKWPLRLSIHHHPPPPFRAPSQRGRRHSWVGVNTGPSSHRLRAPTTACSLSPLSSPTPQPPPNLDMHNRIPSFSPFHSNANASATTHSSPNLRI